MTSTTDPEQLERELGDKTSSLARKFGVPGVAVGVEHEGRRTYAYHGVTSIENPLPVDSRTLFQIGSNTKTFTATAIMRLVERGDLDLQAPVRRYLPELTLRDADVAERVTVLQLLNHTAGWTGDFFADTGQGDDALERYVARLPELDQTWPLGERFSYNNAAFSTAGRVIEKVTGLVYEQALHQLVIDPLGLEDTLFPPQPVRRYAAGHFSFEDGIEVAQGWLLPRSASAAGTLLSTPADMLRYARFHRGDGSAPGGTRLLDQASLERMRQPTVCPGPNGPVDAVGISWMLRKVQDVTTVGHGGGTNGQISAFQTVPERDFAIVVLTNADRGGELNADLVEWALERWLGIQPVRHDPLPVSEAGLEEYAGTYVSQPAVVRFEVKDGGLFATPERTEVGRRWSADFAGPQAQKHQEPAAALELLEGERVRAREGSPRQVGAFLRDGGRIVGYWAGSRLLRRQS